MAGVPRSWYQQQMQQMVPQAGQAAGKWMGQRMQGGQGAEGQRLAAGAKEEGTESKVNAWFAKITDLPREERLSNLEMQPWKNWPKGYAYAKYLAQNMPQPGEMPSTAMQQLRGMEGGPAALGQIGQLLGGKGAGVFPQEQMTAERGLPSYQKAIGATGGAERFGPAYGAAAQEAFKKYPRAEKPLSMQELFKGEAIEAGEFKKAAKWWDETNPERRIVLLREAALKTSEAELGEFGPKWIRAKFEKLGPPKNIEGLSQEKKTFLGLERDPKTGRWNLLEKEDVSPQIQMAYLDLLATDPPEIGDLDASERKNILVVVEGERAIAIGEETKLPGWLEPYIKNPLALADEEMQANCIMDLLNHMPKSHVALVVDLLSRPSIKNMVELERAEKKKKGWW